MKMMIASPSLNRHSVLGTFCSLFVAIILLQGCATNRQDGMAVRRDHVAPILPASSAPPTRATLIAAARAEWPFFGEQQIDMRRDYLSAPRLGLLEDEGEAVQRIALYWRSVGRNLN